MKRLITPALICASLGAGHAAAENQTEQRVEEVVVVASRLPVEPHKVGNAVTVLDEPDIKNLGYEYAADLFRFVPGVHVNRTGGYGGLTQLRVRGAEANHLLVMIDGIDVSAAGSGEFDFSSLLSGDIERIEVLRGPQSGLYGSNALAGVISIHTRQPVEGFSGDVHIEGGGDSTRQAGISLSGGTERIKGRISYIQRESEFDLSEDDSLIGPEDDDDRNQTLSGQFRIAVTDNLDIALFGRHTDKDTDTDGFDFSGGPLQGLTIDDLSVSDTEDQTLGATATLRLADGRSVTQLSLEQTDSELDGRTYGSESEREQIRFDTSWFWQTDADFTQRSTLFLQQEEESFRDLYPGSPSEIPTQERDLFGYGLEHRVEINETLFLTGTVRRDNNDDFEDETTWSVDASYLLNGSNTRLHASYGSGVTNPTFFEQFGFIPGLFVGNPDLVPEKSRGWDAGIEQVFLDETLVVDVTYFDADLEDEIQGLFTTVNNLDGESDRKGVELSVSYQPTDNTSIKGSYTYTDADEPGGEEVRRPEHTASLNVAHTFMDNRARVSGSVVYRGEMLDNDFRNFFVNFAAERVEVDSYTMVNLNASYAVTDSLEVFARVENLFDEDYEEAVRYATPGRTAFAGVRFSFGN